jgi:NAD-dependent dihydropyrimidine dehydrogenase PreA subunit
MPRRITDACTCDGSCKDVCPVECISEGKPIFVIDEDICIDCGACQAVCPSDAIIEV